MSPNRRDIMSEIERIADARSRYHDEVEAQQAAAASRKRHLQMMGVRDALEVLRDSYDFDTEWDEYSRLDGLAIEVDEVLMKLCPHDPTNYHKSSEYDGCICCPHCRADTSDSEIWEKVAE